jgi:hypothetical protein
MLFGYHLRLLLHLNDEKCQGLISLIAAEAVQDSFSLTLIIVSLAFW